MIFFLIGSDQTFSYNLNGHRFLLKGNNLKPIMSFSASFGDYIIDSRFDFDLLSRFKEVSIREYDDVLELKKYGFNARNDLDPTFLLTKEEWLTKIRKYKGKKFKYILVFGTTKDDTTLRFAKQLAKKEKCRVILTNYWGNRLKIGTRIVNKSNCIELLSLIRDAYCVVSHSFHAFAMSINLNVNVYYAMFGSSKSDNRFRTVINLLNLPNHNILDKNIDMTPYDYDEINKILEEKRAYSTEYLKSIKKYAKM